jgi:hypothetical protein
VFFLLRRRLCPTGEATVSGVIGLRIRRVWPNERRVCATSELDGKRATHVVVKPRFDPPRSSQRLNYVCVDCLQKFQQAAVRAERRRLHAETPRSLNGMPSIHV